MTTLMQWRVEQEENLIRFHAHWVRMHKLDPKEYPLEMSPGEWDEQFAAFNGFTAEEIETHVEAAEKKK